MKEKMELLIDSINKYKISLINKYCLEIVEELFLIMEELDENDKKYIKQISTKIFLALNNKDYLLLRDIMQFEMKPIFCEDESE